MVGLDHQARTRTVVVRRLRVVEEKRDLGDIAQVVRPMHEGRVGGGEAAPSVSRVKCDMRIAVVHLGAERQRRFDEGDPHRALGIAAGFTEFDAQRVRDKCEAALQMCQEMYLIDCAPTESRANEIVMRRSSSGPRSARISLEPVSRATLS